MGGEFNILLTKVTLVGYTYPSPLNEVKGKKFALNKLPSIEFLFARSVRCLNPA